MKSVIAIVAFLSVSASSQLANDDYEGLVDDNIIDDEPTIELRDIQSEGDDSVFKPQLQNDPDKIKSEEEDSVHEPADHPSAVINEELAETDSGVNVENEDDLSSLPSIEQPPIGESNAIDVNDVPLLIADELKDALEEIDEVADVAFEKLNEANDDAFTSEIDADGERPVVDAIPESIESHSTDSQEENIHISSAPHQDAEILELRSKVMSLEEKNEQLEENLDYYVKQESFLYKLIGGQMIEFVVITIGLLLIMKISDILLMVTDILEDVVIPIVRSGPVHSMQTKQEVSIIF